MPLDPSIILQARAPQITPPLELATGAMQLRNLGLQGQNAQITLEQNRRALQDQTTIADLYRANTNPDGSVNHQGVIQGLAQAGLGDKIPAYQQQVATAAKDTTAASSAQFDFHKKVLDWQANEMGTLASDPAPTYDKVNAALQRGVSAGLITADQGAAAMRELPGPNQLHQYLVQKALSVTDASKRLEALMPKYNAQDRGDVINEGTIDPMTGQRTAGTNIPKQMTPDEAAKIKLATSGALTDDTKDLMAQRLLAGEKSSSVLGNLGRGQQGAADLRDILNRVGAQAKARGMSPEQIIGMQQDIASQGRTLLELGRREGQIAPRAQELDTFIEQARTASAAVPRGNWQIATKALQWGATQSSDPALGALQIAVDAVINARAAAIGGGVIHVGDQITGHKLLSETNGPEAFEAKMQQFRKEAQGALAAPGEVAAKIRAGRPGAAPAGAGPPVPIKSDADYAGLKSGTRFLAPDGTIRIKP